MSERNDRCPNSKLRNSASNSPKSTKKLLLIASAIGTAAIAISLSPSKSGPDSVTAPVSSTNNTVHDKEQNNYLSSLELTQIYKTGIENLREKAQVADNKRILNLLDMYDKSAVWSDEINGDTGGKNYEDGLCTIKFLTQDDPAWHVQKPLLVTAFSADEKNTAIQIKPHDITDIWASLVFIHELEHVHTRMNDPSAPPDRINDEIDAYGVEMEAMELVSDGKFYAALDRMIQDYRIQGVDDIVEMLRFDDVSRFKSFCSVMQKAITKETYKSRGERILIHGLCPIVAGMRLLEINFGNNQDRLRGEKAKFLQKIWNQDGMRQFH